MFGLSSNSLLTYAPIWAQQKLDETECRVLFLALLASVDTEVDDFDERGRKSKKRVPLVDFRTSAIPANDIVQAHMEQLFKAVLWISNTSSALLKLPRFVISHDTRTLKNVKNWIEAWEEERTAFYDNHRSKNMAIKLSSLEEQLERLIKSSSRSTESYAGTLAKWALDASAFPSVTKLDLETREIYTKLFKLKGFDVFTADKDDLADLVDWMESKLSHGTIFANAVLKHLRKLQDARETGLNKALGLVKGKTFELMDDPVAEHNMAIVAAKAPASLPDPAHYPTRVSYLRARSAWNTAQVLKDKALEDAATEKKKAQELETLDFTTEEELEAAIALEAEDFLQGRLNLTDFNEEN